MFKRLLPREESFFDYFEQHATLIVQGTQVFLELLSDDSNRAAKAKRILELEHETDVITHRCIAALHKTFITPMDRDDIHELITRMDDIMDCMEAAADRIMLYNVKSMMPEAKNMVEILIKQALILEQVVKKLRGGKKNDEILKQCIEINRLENEADTILRQGLARLFHEETDARELIKWKEIFENLEDASDMCEDVANIIEGVIVEGS